MCSYQLQRFHHIQCENTHPETTLSFLPSVSAVYLMLCATKTTTMIYNVKHDHTHTLLDRCTALIHCLYNTALNSYQQVALVL